MIINDVTSTSTNIDLYNLSKKANPGNGNGNGNGNGKKIGQQPTAPTTPTTPTTPTNPTPVNPTPVNPTPVNPTPVNPTPVNPTPVNPISVNPQTQLVTYNQMRQLSVNSTVQDYSTPVVKNDTGVNSLLKSAAHKLQVQETTASQSNSANNLRQLFFLKVKSFVVSMVTNSNPQPNLKPEGEQPATETKPNQSTQGVMENSVQKAKSELNTFVKGQIPQEDLPADKQNLNPAPSNPVTSVPRIDFLA